MVSLILPNIEVRKALQLLGHAKYVVCHLGTCAKPDGGFDWLAQEWLKDSSEIRGPILRISLMLESSIETWLKAVDAVNDTLAIDLMIGEGRNSAQLFFRCSPNFKPCPEEILMIGPGMERLLLSKTESPSVLPKKAPRLIRSSEGWNELFQQIDWQTLRPKAPQRRAYSPYFSGDPLIQHSRTIRALGGQKIWEALTTLPIIVIGCGRGGAVALDLLSSLAFKTMTCIDSDQIQESDFGESPIGFKDSDIGLPKSQRVAELVMKRYQGVRIHAIDSSLVTKEGIDAAKNARLIFLAVDDDAARLTAAILSKLYHIILIDAATGIRNRTESQSKPDPAAIQMGCDIRFIIPGDGCLLCRGGLANYQGAVEAILHNQYQQPQTEWTQQRLGSLRSLNQTAVSLAVRMLEDCFRGALTTSTWLNLEWQQGRLQINYPKSSQNVECSLCRYSGEGDKGLQWF